MEESGLAPQSAATRSQRERNGKPLCNAIKADGEPCGAYALGAAHGPASHLCRMHAIGSGLRVSRPVPDGTEAGEGAGGKGLGQGAGGARHGSTPLDELRALLNRDPKRYAAGLARMLEKGDPRALGMLERLYAVETKVEKPSTIEGLAKLSSADRRKLLAQLEAQR